MAEHSMHQSARDIEAQCHVEGRAAVVCAFDFGVEQPPQISIFNAAGELERIQDAASYFEAERQHRAQQRVEAWGRMKGWLRSIFRGR